MGSESNAPKKSLYEESASVSRRPAVVIPAYKPSQGFLGLLKELSGSKKFSAVVVVDDGSEKEYGAVFQKASELPGVVILHHYVNLGKGRALKTAFNYCLSPEFVLIYRGGVITADADGQHRVSDIIRISEALKKDPEKLVLGCRTFHNGTVPFRSRFGNTLSRIVYRWLCGVNVSDTQTGLRGLPFDFLRTCCRITGEGYEYETNMLLEAKQQKIAIKEIPIETIYENNNAGSHFNPLKDSLKIYSVIFKYSLSSVISVLVDYFVFYFMWRNGHSVLPATYTARLCSAAVNFGINRNVVFRYKGKLAGQLFKYLLLVFFSGTISGIGVSLLKKAFPVSVTVLKAILELFLYFANFYIQRVYIFSK